jgi:transcriptional regulator with XRE-family HTH domain
MKPMPKHEQLRAWRKDRKLTQAGAAGVLGVSPCTFREWESGRKPIRKLVWLALVGLDAGATMHKEAA